MIYIIDCCFFQFEDGLIFTLKQRNRSLIFGAIDIFQRDLQKKERILENKSKTFLFEILAQIFKILAETLHT